MKLTILFVVVGTMMPAHGAKRAAHGQTTLCGSVAVRLGQLYDLAMRYERCCTAVNRSLLPKV
jgi:hypothetical protein